MTHNAVTGLTATNNPRQRNMLQPGTCYVRPIYPKIRTYYFYKVHFEVLYRYRGIHAIKHARSVVPRGGRPRWSVPRTQHRRIKRSCYRWKRKERTVHRKSSLTLRRSFPFHLRLALVLQCLTFPRRRGQMFRINVQLFVAAAAV